MSHRNDARAILRKISEPVRENFPDIANSISRLSDDADFQNLVGRMGTIGGLINVGIYLYNKIRNRYRSRFHRTRTDIGSPRWILTRRGVREKKVESGHQLPSIKE